VRAGVGFVQNNAFITVFYAVACHMLAQSVILLLLLLLMMVMGS
jgi:hypothetical protein